MGPSGCGKSTLLKLIVGQEKLTKGIILIDGEPVGHPDSKRGIVYQKYSLFPFLNVLGNVMIGMKLSNNKRRTSDDSVLSSKKLSRKEIKEEAEYFIEKIGLIDSAHKFPHQLSGGMQQRVALAQSLIMKPKILLMDEPFGALDPGTREDMQIFLLELWDEFHMTVFFVTHDLEEAVFLGTRVIVLSQYYSDDRVGDDYSKHGAKVVADHPLSQSVMSTKYKETAQFGELIQQLRRDGFDPSYLQNVRDFNLKHSDSFQTLHAGDEE